jgi:hypothetical protein
MEGMESVVVIWGLAAPEAGEDFRCEYEYCNREPIAAVQVPGMRERKFCIFHVPPWARLRRQ